MNSKKISVIFCLLTCAINIEASNEQNTKQTVLKDAPIVIETPEQHYEQPTIDEYTQCHHNLSRCRSTCSTARNQSSCEAECPVCPILIQQEVLVQGINDTQYRGSVDKPLNTTNIIRVTNEIHNRIETQLGNITANNQNNIQVHQNISTSGGKFGLGYNERGSCCLVLRPSQNCKDSERPKRSKCRHKRHRVCGPKCKARYMRAKTITYCTDDGEDCQHRIEYIPYKRQSSSEMPCHYIPQWPFVSCPNQHHMPSFHACSRCLTLPYIYILQNGIPAQCTKCYGMPGHIGPYMNPYMPPIWQYPMVSYPGYQNRPRPPFDQIDIENGFLPTENWGWKIEKTKCRTPDGQIIDDCHKHDNRENTEGSGHGIITDPFDYLAEEDEDQSLPDEYLDWPAPRHRRHTFKRSKYSKRNRY